MKSQATSHRLVKATLRSIITRISGTASLIIFATSAFAQDIEFDIERQATNETLLELAETAGIQIAFAADRASQSTSPAISGSQSVEQALDGALVGTGLDYQFANEDFVVVMADNGLNVQPNVVQTVNTESVPMLAQLQAAAQQTQTGSPNNATTEEDKDTDQIEEIIVTGSNIRGAESASPVFTFDREEIQQTGLSTTEEFVRRLPQNFGGGTTDNSIQGTLGGEGSSLNFHNATGVNLRGLGNDATLVLQNGRRVAPSGLGDATDLSMIPLAAIERIEVLTDGASAIYGSDAVAGVVNFVLRDDFDGAETKLQYGDTTQGGAEEILFGQTFGNSWDSGNFLFGYNFRERNQLDEAQRTFTQEDDGPHDLLPKTTQHSGFFTIRQGLTDKIDFFADLFYTSRDTETTATFSSGTNSSISFADNDQYNVTAGADLELSDTWKSEISVLYGRNEVVSHGIRIPSGDPTGNFFDTQTEVRSFDAVADGTVFRLSGGEAKLALGGQFRNESLFRARNAHADVNDSRDIYAIFGEMLVPIIGESNSRAGLQRLEITAALRYEDYSDFGSTTNPKFGLLWSPSESLNFRGTWGTSFRAPQLHELDGASGVARAFIFNYPDPMSVRPDGTTPVLALGGNNENLIPEEATTWTVGADFQSASLPGFSASITYFDIDFENRISKGIPDAQTFNAFFSEDIFAEFIIRDADPAEILFWASQPDFIGIFCACALSDVTVMFDRRLANLARTEESGLDLNVSYGFDSEVGSFDFNLGGTYLLERDFTLTATAPTLETLNAPSDPADLKLRSSVIWNNENGWSTAFFVNYVDGYPDSRPGLEGHISSWTTVDLSISYNSSDAHNSGLFKDTIVSLNTQNLFDRDPPFVVGQGHNFNFDATNANALGRFVSLNITKKW